VIPGVLVSARGSSIYLEDSGRGRVPVLALHGLGGGAYFFRGLAERLQPRYRLLAVDLPGTGRSVSGTPLWSIDSWIADLCELAATRIGAPAVLLGHSLGTIVALQMAERCPQHARALIAVGGLPRARPEIRQRLAQRAAHVAQSGMSGLGAQVAAGVFSPASFRARPEAIAMFERLFEAQPPDAYLRAIDILVRASAEPAVPLVQVPCTAITGEDDQYAPPEAVRVFASSLPVACPTHVIPACAHMPFFEAPDEFAALVESSQEKR
jgi:pimeloyl-ACP methyl ester carboxylesterase